MAELVCGVDGSTGEEIVDEINRQGNLLRGNLWVFDQDYLIGDVISYGGIAYTALADSTGTPPPLNLVWKAIGLSFVEVGGVPWTSSTNYLAGIIVSRNTGIYMAIIANTNVAPESDPATWQDLLGAGELGGRLWQVGLSYLIGDIVSNLGVVYLAVEDTTGEVPGAGTAWAELDSTRYTAGIYTPVAGTEYPDPVGETEGATWTVDGLGAGVGYTYLEDPFTGRIAYDGDIVTWLDPNWVLVNKPRLERTFFSPC